MDESWRERAACKGAGIRAFFPPASDGRVEHYKRGPDAEAKAVCLTCPVKRACLDYAIVNDVGHGVWGGLSPVERQAVRRGELVA